MYRTARPGGDVVVCKMNDGRQYMYAVQVREPDTGVGAVGSVVDDPYATREHNAFEVDLNDPSVAVLNYDPAVIGIPKRFAYFLLGSMVAVGLVYTVVLCILVAFGQNPFCTGYMYGRFWNAFE